MNRDYWNALAADFSSDVLEITQHDLHGVLIEEIKEASKFGQTAADLCCGVGSTVKLLAQYFKRIYAIDFAAELLEVAAHVNDFPAVEYLQRDLTSQDFLKLNADVTFSINVLINPSSEQRYAIACTVWHATKHNGLSVFVVPSFESILNVYKRVIQCELKTTSNRQAVINKLEKNYAQEIISSVDGIVNIGGTQTKCYTKEELVVFLKELGYYIERIRKIEYSWDEEIENAPNWLQSPYPWDWLVVAKKS